MRKAEDWYLSKDDTIGYYVDSDEARDEYFEFIKKIQIDAIDATVKLCAENAELNYGEGEGQSTELNIQSILNCAEILKKEL